MFDYLGWGKHLYSLAATGIKFKDKEYTSRKSAEHDMYAFMNKHGLRIEKVYDDNHFKTYICQNNIRFYINRM